MEEIAGRFVIGGSMVPGRLCVDAGRIAGLESDGEAASGPIVAPGFIDIHVHGWGGHSTMGGRAALDRMARALAARGVTSFLPTAVTASLDDLGAFADSVRSWAASPPPDGAQPLGFNLEGPFLSSQRAGAQDPAHLLVPRRIAAGALEPLRDGLRVITIAPELDGAPDLIGDLTRAGVVVSLGHSAATFESAEAGFAAGARSTTHLFNAMTGLDGRAPGLAAAALAHDEAFVELIADGQHVHPVLWRLVAQLKPDRLILVSDAIAAGGSGDGRMTLGGLEVDVADGRATLAGTDTLAGSVIALDDAVRNLVGAGIALPQAVGAATANPVALLGLDDRGKLEQGRRADLVVLTDDLAVARVMIGGRWLARE